MVHSTRHQSVVAGGADSDQQAYQAGRVTLAGELAELIVELARDNPRWGVARIQGERHRRPEGRAACGGQVDGAAHYGLRATAP